MTGDELVASVRLKASLPMAQATFLPSNILQIADEEMISFLVPLISSVREEYYVTFLDLEYTPAALGQLTYYRIPSRAFAQKLRAVKILFAGGSERTLDRVPYDRFQDRHYGFYVAGSFVYLVGVTDALAVRLVYEQKPNKLTLLEKAARITAFTSTTITLGNVPDDWVAGPLTVDLIRGVSPHDSLDWDRTVTLAGSVLTFTDGFPLPAELTVEQDYVALAGQTPFVQAPDVCDTLLAQRVAVKCLESLGALDELKAAVVVLTDMKKTALGSLTNRVEGASPVIVVDNPLFRNN